MDLNKLIFGTHPLALIALGGFVRVPIVTLGLFIFFKLKKLPSRSCREAISTERSSNWMDSVRAAEVALRAHVCKPIGPLRF